MTIFLIIITVIVSIMAFNNEELFNKLKFNAYMVWHKKDYARMLSHGLIHADWMHLGVNMFVLWSFGELIEKVFSMQAFFPKTYYFGDFLYVLMYILSLAVSTIASLLKHKENHYYNAIGASGAVSAIVFTSILIFPTEKIYIIFFPFFGIPNVIFGLAYMWYSFHMSKNSSDNVGHEAHLTGAIFGLIFPIILNPNLVSNFIWQVFGI